MMETNEDKTTTCGKKREANATEETKKEMVTEEKREVERKTRKRRSRGSINRNRSGRDRKRSINPCVVGQPDATNTAITTSARSDNNNKKKQKKRRKFNLEVSVVRGKKRVKVLKATNDDLQQKLRRRKIK